MQVRPLVIADDVGGFYVVWEDHRSNPVSLFATRLGPAGEVGWTGGKVITPPNLRFDPPVPNPFSSLTRISFSLPTDQLVTVELFDVTGRLVRTLISARLFDAGQHSVGLTAVDEQGRRLPAGVYLMRGVFEQGQTLQRKVVLTP